MRSLKAKYTTNGIVGRLSIASPHAATGNNDDASVQIREIVNIPDEVSDAQVLSLYDATADCTFLSGAARLTFDFSELGPGRIIR